MSALILQSILGFMFWKCDGYNVLPFGSSQGDQLNPKTDDGCGEEITLPFNFTFYEKSYQKIWVCNNGILSFSGSNSEYVPRAFPIENAVLISLFWADIDNRIELGDGNDIYWRLDTRRPTLHYISSVITTNTATTNFEAVWVLVTTWYKVGYYPNRIDFFNTFQIVLTCDDKKRCFCLFAYSDIQWTAAGTQLVHAQAGFNDGTGKYEVLPGSRSAEVRNLVMKSNVDVNGLFIYKVTETGVDADLGCSRKIEPALANMYFEPRDFRLQGFLCGRQDLSHNLNEIPVMFIGQSYSITTKAKILKDRKTVAGNLPFWGRAEQVRVLPLLEVVEMREAVTMQFLSSTLKTSSSSAEVRVTQSEIKDTKDEIFLTLEWDPNYWTSIHGIDAPSSIHIALFVVNYVEHESNEVPFKIKLLLKTSAANTGRADVTSFLKDGSVFVVLDTQEVPDDCEEDEVKSLSDYSLQPIGTVSPAVTKVKRSACKIWYKKEKEKLNLQKKPWFQTVANTFGCPRNSISRRDRTDVWFARTEVTSGLNGWEYDPCCSPTHAVIDPHCFGCQYNSGAEFCIQSPGLLIEEREENFNNFPVLASNQCCYGRNGKLLRSENEGAGNAKKSVNSPETYLDFLNNEISPFLACKEENLKHLYYEVRPIAVGSYVPRRTVINWGDPHMRTLDGFEYTFNGLGVYAMTKTAQGLMNNLTMQVSTRRVGNGTVFSGFVIEDIFTNIEFFLTESNGPIVAINGSTIQTDDVIKLNQDGVLYKRDENSTEFGFKMAQTDFIVKAVISKNGVLNLGISPPFNFEGSLLGLLGNYDGVSENDLLSKDGEAISIDVSLMTIHEKFGESWAVAEEDWLFSLDTAGLVKDDITRGMPYTPVYTPQFDNEELKQHAEEVCGEDESCLLDTALTGQIEFAENAVHVKTLIEASEVLNEVVDEYIRQSYAPLFFTFHPFGVYCFFFISTKLLRSSF